MFFNNILVSSPRPWGCFYAEQMKVIDSLVFPTPVGVFPCGGKPPSGIWSLPHARGGVSSIFGGVDIARQSSPRPWGCFRRLA